MTDENFDNDKIGEMEDFATLLEQSMSGMTELQPGQKIEATVLQIGPEWVFLDVGQKGEGVLDVNELLNHEGALTVKEGDRIGVYFLSRRGGELNFTTRLGGGSSGTAQLEDAWRNKIPVEGRIEKEIKGGYEVILPGNVRSFCPYSQLGLRRSDDLATVIGQVLSFKINKFSEQGRNIVVSHRDIVEEERRQKRETLKETLKEGMVVKGTITNLRDFGAFVDIGGLEGLLPIAEVAYGRIEDISDVLHPGQEVEVAVKKVDWDQERFTFSLRDTMADPWNKVNTVYKVGAMLNGTVSRLTKFGAFITLEDGIDGLLHISKINGDQRIRHSQDVLRIGQTIKVIIEKIDADQRRISLTQASEQDENEIETSYEEDNTTMGTFADLFRKAQQEKCKKE